MIAPKQLAEALDRLDPRDRELLSLSLRRRVPDEALAEVFGVENAEIARRRARAIERLADEMDLQRGEELGAVLKALLEPDTWSEAAAALGEEFAAGAGASAPAARLAAVPSGPALVPVPDEPPPAEPEPAPRRPAPRSCRCPLSRCWRCWPRVSARRPIHPAERCCGRSWGWASPPWWARRE